MLGRIAMRLSGLVVVALSVGSIGCGATPSEERDSEAERAAADRVAPVSSQPPSATPPGDADSQTTGHDTPVASAPDPQIPALDSGVPAVSRGPAIRLESVEVGARTVGKLEVPTVAIADLESRAALDERLLRHAEFGRCEIMLALETFVSLRCREVRTQAGVKQHDHHIAHFVIGASGDVKEVEVWTLFHPGEAEPNMPGRLVHDPGAGARRVVATEHGIELSYPFDGADEIDRLPWRAIAPYVRTDGALGPALRAEGLPLAPPETQLPIAPVSPALWAKSEQALLKVWAAAPPRVRARARLATTGGHNPAGLVFAPDIATGEVAELEGKLVERGIGYYTHLIALVVAVRTREAVELRQDRSAGTESVAGESGPDHGVLQSIPAQTVLTSVDGLVHGLDSAPGTAGWAYVVTPEGVAGWVSGTSLEVLGASHEAHAE